MAQGAHINGNPRQAITDELIYIDRVLKELKSQQGNGPVFDDTQAGFSDVEGFGLLNPPLNESSVGNTFMNGFTGGADEKFVSKFTVPEDGFIKRMLIKGDPPGITPATTHIKGIIYEDSGGLPGALFAVTDEITVTDQSFPPPWLVGQFSGAYEDKPIPAGTYWLGSHSDDDYTQRVGSYFGNQTRTRSDNYADGPSNPFGTSTLAFSDFAVTVQLVYQPGSGVGQIGGVIGGYQSGQAVAGLSLYTMDMYLFDGWTIEQLLELGADNLFPRGVEWLEAAFDNYLLITELGFRYSAHYSLFGFADEALTTNQAGVIEKRFRQDHGAIPGITESDNNPLGATSNDLDTHIRFITRRFV